MYNKLKELGERYKMRGVVKTPLLCFLLW